MMCNPIVSGSKLAKDENGEVVDASKYKHIVGSLVYLLATKLNLAYSTCLVARYMERPTEMHLQTIKKNSEILERNCQLWSHVQERRKSEIDWLDIFRLCW